MITPPQILERIAEAEICEWMNARISQLRERGLDVNNVSVAAHFYGHESKPECCWGMHALDACVISEPDSQTAFGKLLKLCDHDPMEKAREKRRQAESLLADAQQLENFAAKK